jgi:hypothetical protein
MDLKKLGVIPPKETDVSPVKLKQAHGEAVCFVLDTLTQMALDKQKFDFKPPAYPSNMLFSEEEEPAEEEQDIDDSVEIAVQSDDEEEYVLHPHQTVKLDDDET